MTLKVKYFLFVGILHIVLIILTFYLLKEDQLFFLLAELLILLSLYMSYRLYKAFIRPVNLMLSGTSAIKDQDFNVTFVNTGSVEMDQLIEVYNMMIKKIRTERVSLQEQHFFLEKLIDAIPSGIVLLNYDDEIVLLNPAAREILKAGDELLSRSISSVENPLLAAAAQIPNGGSEIISIEGWRKYRCHFSHFMHRGFNRKFLIIEELSREILETEKNAYGKVIRMMAHEVNNSIGAVNSILQSLRDIHEQEQHGEEGNEIAGALDTALGRNERLNTFMKNFAEVIRLPKPYKEEMDLNELSNRIIDLMRSGAENEGISIEMDFHPKPVMVEIDIPQMEQVLINIIKNSIEAIESEGTIRFKTSLNPPTLMVSDNGEGINEEVHNNIFKPFYSSKPQGQGIGLTLIREILHQHNAQFSLETNSSGWTTFTIVF